MARTNVGYWYRSGRGWFTTEGKTSLPLKAEDGSHLKEKKTSATELRAALARHVADRKTAAVQAADMLVAEVCNRYLASIEKDGSHNQRGRLLFDFCTGFPGRFWNAKTKPTATDRIHKGFGDLTASELIKGHVAEWIAKHPDWSKEGGQRTAIQAIKRALNWAVEFELIARNPIKGYKVAAGRARVTYFTPEQEAALLANARPAFRQALQVCIRTGARFGCEFAALEARHVVEEDNVQFWVFPANETKSRKKERRIYVPREIAEVVRLRLAAMSRGQRFVFVNSMGETWSKDNLSERFRTLKDRIKRKGVKLDTDACMYSCRHTFAKRILNGYWSGGRPTTLEHLAELMGNTPEVCRKYAKFVESYRQPLLDAVGA